MSSHTCQPGHPGILADDCPRCDEHAAEFPPLALDDSKMAELWNRMVEVEIQDVAHYQTGNEAKAGASLHRLGIWLERYTNVSPWVPFDQLAFRIGGRP